MVQSALILHLAVAVAATVYAYTSMPRVAIKHYQAPLHHHQSCRHLPGDAGWPSKMAWDHLNETVGGRLIATVPLAHVCHDHGISPGYNETACSDLRGKIVDEGAQILYMGKSTGKGSLALWMYNLKTVQVMDHFRYDNNGNGPGARYDYSGPAVKLGPGVIAGEAYEAVSAAGYRIVGPECGLTGIAGGYLQGGGHSQLATAYGMAADQVLEWEVVTPAGEYVIATPENRHADLYWALAGGGGGTFGVVLSVTVAAYPDAPVAGGSMAVDNTNDTAFWEAVGIWFHQSPAFVVDSPNNVQFIVTNATLAVFAFTLPGQDASAVETLLSSFLPELESRGLPFTLSTAQHPSYVDSLRSAYGELPYGSLCPNYPVISSRLIPRSTVLDTKANAKLMDVYRSITADGTWFVGCSIINTSDDSHHGGESSPSIRPRHPPNAVHPAWRNAIAYCNPNRPWDWNDPEGSVAAKNKLVGEYFPAMEAATPGSGVYLNEMDPLYRGDWKDSMYGVNYDRLLRIKHAYDPHRLMYAHFAVGADEFAIDDKGRLCDL